MGILDLDNSDNNKIDFRAGVENVFSNEDNDNSLSIKVIKSDRFDPNRFSMDGSVMANYDVYDFANNQNQLSELHEDMNIEIKSPEKTMNKTMDDFIDNSSLTEESKDNLSENNSPIKMPSYRTLQKMRPICREVEIPKSSTLRQNDKASPLLLVTKNDDYQVYAYNVETKKIEADTRASIISRESKVDSMNDRKVNPSNFVPIHYKDYEFNLLKRLTLRNKDIIITRSDNTRTICPFSDDFCFNSQNPIGYLLKTAIYNYRKINGLLDSQRNIQYQVDRRLKDALNTIETLADGKLVFRREYNIHYDEAISVIEKFVNNEYDINRDTIMYSIGLLLRSHPAIVSHDDEEHNRPYIITVVFDTIIDVESFLPNSHTGKNITTKTFIVPWLSKAFHIGEFSTSLTWDEISSSMDENVRTSLTECPASTFNGITIVKDGSPQIYYYKIGRDIHSIWSTSDRNRQEGIYLYDITREDLTKNQEVPVYKEPVFIDIEKSEKHGFFTSKRDCEMDGDIESHSKITSAYANLEAARTSLQSHRENQNTFKVKSSFIEKEENARQKAMELKIMELEKKAEVERIRDYYEERSHERKDTSEIIKFAPTVIGGLVGIATAIGLSSVIYRKEKSLGLNILKGFISSQTKGYLAIIGGIYAIGSTIRDMVKYAKKRGWFSDAFQVAKDITSSLYEGARKVGTAVYSTTRSIVKGVYNTASDVMRGVGSFVSDCFSFMW